MSLCLLLMGSNFILKEVIVLVEVSKARLIVVTSSFSAFFRVRCSRCKSS